MSWHQNGRCLIFYCLFVINIIITSQCLLSSATMRLQPPITRKSALRYVCKLASPTIRPIVSVRVCRVGGALLLIRPATEATHPNYLSPSSARSWTDSTWVKHSMGTLNKGCQYTGLWPLSTPPLETFFSKLLFNPILKKGFSYQPIQDIHFRDSHNIKLS